MCATFGYTINFMTMSYLDKFLKRGLFYKLVLQMGLFSNYFLHGVIFYVKAMQIAKGINKFELRVTHALVSPI